MVKTADKNYLNTLMFTVVAEAISVLIIGLLAFEAISPYSAFLLTLEVGLIIVIIWTLYAIKRYQDKMNKQFKILQETKVFNVPCPDYFVRDSDDDGNLLCKNGYTTPDRRITYTFFPDRNADKESDAFRKISTIDMKNTFEDKSLQDVCKSQFKDDGDFVNIPWTSIKPNCPNLDDYDDYSEYAKLNTKKRI